jgi:type IV secretion system protein VirB8
MSLLDIFKKKGSKESQSADHSVLQSANPAAHAAIRGNAHESNWYVDKYQQLIVQRNLFFILTALSLVFIGVGVVVIGGVISTKRIEPLVVEVDELSGITTLVNPNKDKSWQMSTAINHYFLQIYLRARETYDVASYLYNYNTIVRLMSSSSVYRDFKSAVNNPNVSPVLRYSSLNSTTLEIRSILKQTSTAGGNQNAQIRFTIVEQKGGRRFNKIASIIWDYVEMNLNEDDRAVNPLGFQVQFYAVTDDSNA